MNKLDYSVSLRKEGLDSIAMRKRMLENGFEESEIECYLSKSDELFLNEILEQKTLKSTKRKNYPLKYAGLGLSLIPLLAVLFGYVRIGLLGLCVLWIIIGLVSPNKR